jgi:hypothetical protein
VGNGLITIRELKAAGVPVLHYYSMGKSENIRQIAVTFKVIWERSNPTF